MTKVIIIEDEERAALMLEIMLKETDKQIDVIEKCYDLPSGVISIKKNHPQLVFLDIEMPGYSGLQIFNFFEKPEINFDLIFTTAFNDYAVKAFEMNAIDYLLKPIQSDKLNTAIEKYLKRAKTFNFNQISLLREYFQIDKTQKIIIPFGNGFEVLKIHEIRYFLAAGSYTRVFTGKEQSILVSKRIKFFEEGLKNYPMFFRIHRSYIINLQWVKKILKTDGGTIVMEDGIMLPISNERIREFIKAIEK
jgi:two-component system LytT family response regulator